MIKKIRQNKPLILCLTNTVVQNFTANCLLAIGCSPIMPNDIREIEELIEISNALLVNIGTLGLEQELLYEKAIFFAMKKNIPIVLDPVASGASIIRTNLAKKLISISSGYDKFIIKGNASEIISLDKKIVSKGVDSTDKS